MKRLLLAAAVIPFVVGCASDRGANSRAAMDNDPAYVEAEGYQRTERYDNRYRGSTEDTLEGRREVRDPVEDSTGTPEYDSDAELDTIENYPDPVVDDAEALHDPVPDRYTSEGLNSWHKHRWMRFQY